MEDNRAFFEAIILSFDHTEVGQLFGKPCGKINKKAFVAFYQDQMVFKLGKEEVNLLKAKYDGACNWDPSKKNRPMKDWLQVPAIYRADWQDLAQAALDYYQAQA